MNSPTAAAASPTVERPWSIRVLRVLGAWFAVEVVMIGAAIGWVAVYSYLIAPGHAPSHYEDYAQSASPVVCLVISAPVFGALGFLCGRRRGRDGVRFARTTTFVFLAIDGTIMALVPDVSAGMWLVWTAAAALKLGGVMLGGRLGARAADARG